MIYYNDITILLISKSMIVFYVFFKLNIVQVYISNYFKYSMYTQFADLYVLLECRHFK